MVCSTPMMRFFSIWGLSALAFFVFPGEVRADEVQQQIQVLIQGPRSRQAHAVERLRYLGAARSGPALRVLLTHPTPGVRIAVSDALVRVLDPSSAPALAAALTSDADWEVRRNSADALGALVAKSQRAALVTASRTDAHRFVRKASVIALGKLGGAGNALAQSASSDSDFEVRLAALDALSRGSNRKSLVPVRKLLEDRSTMIQFAAARALAWNDDAAGRGFLKRAIESENEEEVERAIIVLADLPKGWVADLLFGATKRRTESAVDAAKALAKRDDKRGLPSLVALSVVEGELGAAARAALDELGVDVATQDAVSREQEP